MSEAGQKESEFDADSYLKLVEKTKSRFHGTEHHSDQEHRRGSISTAVNSVVLKAPELRKAGRLRKAIGIIRGFHPEENEHLDEMLQMLVDKGIFSVDEVVIEDE